MRRIVCCVDYWLTTVCSASAQEHKDTFPKEPGAAWKKAEASVGWMRPERDSGSLVFTENREELEPSKSVPALWLYRWPVDKVSELPLPAQPFGLNLGGSRLTDTELQELTGFKQLTMLDLRSTRVTAVGLKALANFPRLKIVALSREQLTDDALKTLRELQALQALEGAHALGGKRATQAAEVAALSLTRTSVTDAGSRS